jgi:PhnB protein
MATTTPYLHFNGNCLEAFNFYKTIFGGEFDNLMRYSDVPGTTDKSDKILNVGLSVGPGSAIMGSDNPPGYGEDAVFGTNFSIVLNVDGRDEADRVFNGLSAGGKITAPIGDMFWGAYFGMFVDKFGIPWMVSFQQKPA